MQNEVKNKTVDTGYSDNLFLKNYFKIILDDEN